MRRLLWASALLAGVLAAIWLAGFAWFVLGTAELGAAPAAATPDRADGIVVLTGGADRIATGVRLLQGGRARVMLISGVGHGAELGALLRGTGTNAASLAGRITLGREATSTTGNADEAADWVAAEGLHSLLVVTASYHMRRALTELQRSLPGVALVAVPVLPPALRRNGHLLHLGTLRLLAGEYTKYLAASLDLARLGTEAAPGPAGRVGPAP